MKLKFCVFCGATHGLEHHHVLAKSIGGDDNDHNLITVCFKHHGMIHNIKRRSDMRCLQKIGIKKAQARGAYVNVGRKPVTRKIINEINKLTLAGFRVAEIVGLLKIGRSTVYKVRDTLKK